MELLSREVMQLAPWDQPHWQDGDQHLLASLVNSGGSRNHPDMIAGQCGRISVSPEHRPLKELQVSTPEQVPWEGLVLWARVLGPTHRPLCHYVADSGLQACSKGAGRNLGNPEAIWVIAGASVTLDISWKRAGHPPSFLCLYHQSPPLEASFTHTP